MNEVKTRIDIESPKLLSEILKYIRENEQVTGYFSDLGILEQPKPGQKILYSKLEPFDIIWKFTRYFNQVAVGTCQFVEIALVDEKTRKNNADTKVSYNCGLHQVWYNAAISTRLSEFSRGF